MIFQVIGQWMLDGQSPNTGLPVTETRRIVKLQGGVWERDERGNKLGELWTPVPCQYRIGQDYALQLGRGLKAVGRTPKVASIARQDVRDMTPQQAVASGFATVLDYLLAWTQLHDVPARGYADCDLLLGEYGTEYPEHYRSWRVIEGDHWLRYLRTRPAERYQAWIIRFEEVT